MTRTYSWAIADIDGPAHRSGTADSNAEAWMLALAAGRAALLAGDLDTLAVTVDDDIATVLYDPARDEHGKLDPADVTADLVETYQESIAGDVAVQLVAGRFE
jgi:hypothetical protein